jgi:hypothetical protein
MPNESDYHIIFRDGLSQSGRMLPELSPAHFAVEERSTADLIRFAQAFAKELQFFDLDGKITGDWSSFLSAEEIGISVEEMVQFMEDPTLFDDQPRKKEWLSRPHFGLFLLFLDMLKAPREELQRLTQRHLSYYFKSVLGFKPKPAIPDRVHVLFELAKDRIKHPLAKGTLLHAGKDEEGNALQYQLTEDLLITNAKVAELCRVYEDSSGIMLAERRPAVFDGKDKFQAFGTDLSASNKSNWAPFGFALSAPILELSEGKRTIYLTFAFTNEGAFNLNTEDGLKVLQATLIDLLQFAVHTTEGWTNLKASKGSMDIKERKVTLSLELSPGQPALAPNEQFGEGKYPVLKVTPNWQQIHLEGKYADLQKLKTLRHASIGLAVIVEGLKDLPIRNDEAILNNKGTFYPFGTWPRTGSAFSFTHKELITKPITGIDLQVTWKGKNGTFETRYSGYPEIEKTWETPESNKEECFKASLQAVNGNLTTQPTSLFHSEKGIRIRTLLHSISTL